MTTKNRGVTALTRRSLMAGAAGIVLALAMPQAAFAEKRDDATRTIITNFNRPKSVASTVTEIVTDPAKALPMLSTGSVATMQIALSRYEQIAAKGGWPEINSQRVVMRGARGETVLVLRNRLFLEGYLKEEDTKNEKFDKDLEAAVKQFQESHGLLQTGRLDGPTIAELNVPVEARIEQMRVNLPRLAHYAQGLEGQRYLIVNVPATQLEVVNADGKVYSRHNIIAGKPARPSPVVAAALADINFNPYWNAPVSIVERDIIPAILKDANTLKKMNMKVFDGYGGPEVDPATVDWATVRPDRYFFRQEPGPENAMATVKINFPSPFGVYMHDTPTKQLFDQAVRYESSGCVRVDQVHVLVDWILSGQDGWNRDRIEEVSQKVERLDVKIANPPQLRWVYLTAWALPNGEVHFRPDVYELDGTGFISGQPTPVGELAPDGRRWLDKMPPAPVLGSAAEAASPEDAALPAQESAAQATSN